MERWWRRGLGPLIAFSLALAACGGGDGQGPEREGGQNLQGQQLKVLGIWAEPEQSRFRKVLDLFEQQTGAQVTYTSGGDETPTVLGTQIEGGDPPDVAFLAQPATLEQFVERGQLKPVDEAAGDALTANYSEDWRELVTFDGATYGVPFKASNKSTFWYNTKVFTDAGVEPPDSWEQLTQIADTIEASGVTPFSVGGADGWTLTDWFENVYIRTAGPENYDLLTNHEIPWTHDSVKQALRRLAEIWGRRGWVAGGNSGATQVEFPTSVTQTFAENPKAAMVYEGDFVANVITGDTEATLGEDADFFPFPAIDGSQPAVVFSADMAVMPKDSEGARALIEFLATPEAAEAWAGQSGFVSPNQNVDLSVYPDDITRRAAQSLVEAETARFDMSDLVPPQFGARPGAGLWKLFQDFLRDPDAIDQVTRRMEQAAERAYS